MIGGTDVMLEVQAGVPVSDVIFRAVRRHWPAYVYQNADDETTPFTRSPGAGLPKPTGREFFVYRDEQAALSWDEHGAIPENFNTMLHVILGKDPSGPGPCSVT